jgi:hypothetical protein
MVALALKEISGVVGVALSISQTTLQCILAMFYLSKLLPVG